MRRLILSCLILMLALSASAREVGPTRSGNDVLFIDGAGSPFLPTVLDGLLGVGGWDVADPDQLPEIEGELLSLLRGYGVVIWETSATATHLVRDHEMVNRYVNPATPDIRPGRLLLVTTSIRALPLSFLMEVVHALPANLSTFSVDSGLMAFPYRPELSDLTSLDSVLARATALEPEPDAEELYRMEYCVRCYGSRPPFDPLVAVRWPPYEPAVPNCRVTTLSFTPEHFSGAAEAVRRVLVHEMGVRNDFDDSAGAGEVGLAVGNAGYLGTLFSSPEFSCRYPATGFIEHLFHGGLWVGAIAPDGARRVSTAAFSANNLVAADEVREYLWIDGSSDHWSNDPASDHYHPAALAPSHRTTRFRDDAVLESGAHVPLGLTVRLDALSWGDPDHDDGVALGYTIRNDSSNVLRDVYAGLWMDTTVGNILVTDPYNSGAPVSWNYYDDVNGAVRPTGEPDDPGLWMMWEHDGDGDDGQAPTWIGTVWLGASAPLPDVSVNHWNYRRDPLEDEDYFDENAGEMVEGRYTAMGNLDFDTGDPYDSMYDWNGLLSAGPHPTLAAGDSLRVDFAVVCGVDSLHLLANAVRLRDLYLNDYVIVATQFGGLWAERAGAAVHLRWALLADESATGLHVWRGEARLTDVALPADAGRYEDPAAPTGAADYRLQLVEADGTTRWLGAVSVGSVLPSAPRLEGAAPNPFNPSTTIHWALPTPGRAVLSVHDLRGRRLAVLAEGDFTAGPQATEWNGRAADGRVLPSGTYVVRLQSGMTLESLRVQLVR